MIVFAYMQRQFHTSERLDVGLMVAPFGVDAERLGPYGTAYTKQFYQVIEHCRPRALLESTNCRVGGRLRKTGKGFELSEIAVSDQACQLGQRTAQLAGGADQVTGYWFEPLVGGYSASLLVERLEQLPAPDQIFLTLREFVTDERIAQLHDLKIAALEKAA